MPLDAKKVLYGAPDQSSTVGAVNVAPIGTTLPKTATEELKGFDSCGYVSQDGVSLTQDYSTTDLKDWSASTIRTILEEFLGEAGLVFMQTGYEELCVIFGEDHVKKVPANEEHGEQIIVSIGAHLPEPKSFVFNMKDGDKKLRLVIPNGQAVPDGDLTFVANENIGWGCKITCNADENGENIYILTDDNAKITSTDGGDDGDQDGE